MESQTWKLFLRFGFQIKLLKLILIKILCTAVSKKLRQFKISKIWVIFKFTEVYILCRI